MYKRYAKIITLIIIYFTIFLNVQILNRVFASEGNKIKVIEFRKDQYKNSRFYLSIKNISDSPISPQVRIVFKKNMVENKFLFTNINTIFPSEEKLLDIDIDSDWSFLNINSVDIQILEDGKIIGERKTAFILAKRPDSQKAILLLTSLTLGTGLFFATRFI